MEMKEISPGENKINEYITRINNGEPKDNILDGLPESFRKSIENGLNQINNQRDNEKREDLNVPPQYEGLPSYVLEEIWTIPVYVDNEKTVTEIKRKRLIIEKLREIEQGKAEIAEQVTSDNERIGELKKIIRQPESSEHTENGTDFESFSVSNGETDTGIFWYQYRNRAAKQLKSEGKFEWGKERVYFDIKMEDMKRLSNLVMKVASESNVAIAFKFLDEEKTTDVNKDGKETRFVANFATEDDAKKFMVAIMSDSLYKSFVSDRNLDYNGVRLDGIAQYASGFRETRAALERIMNGKPNPDGISYSYLAESGKTMTIPITDYEGFKKRYEDTSLLMQKKKAEWDALLQTSRF